MRISEIEKLLISPQGDRGNPAWSPEAHMIDDTKNRAAYLGLMAKHHEEEAARYMRARAVCIADAERQEAATGLECLVSVEYIVRAIEDSWDRR